MSVKNFDNCNAKFVSGIRTFLSGLILLIISASFFSPLIHSEAAGLCGRFLSEALSEKIVGRGGFSVISNEGTLYKVLPFVRGAKGAGLGVGLDQMLDFLVNSNLSRIYIMDISPHVSHTTRAILEVGRIHKINFGRYPRPIEYIDYFSPQKISATLKMIGQEFSFDDLKIVQQEFTVRLKRKNETQETASGPLSINRYLQYKMSQKEYSSWISTEKNINKVLDMYESGAITLVIGDLAGEKSLNAIANHMGTEGTKLGLVYLSNAEYYVDRSLPGFHSGPYAQYRSNMANMPVTNATIFISTNQLSSKVPPKPYSILMDPYLNDHFLEWEFFLQTQADRDFEKQGHYTTTLDGKVYRLDRLDRLYLFREEGRGYGIQEPSPGIFLAGYSR